MITDDNFITLLGSTRNRLKFDSLDEYVIYSLIHTFSQSKHGVYDGNLQFISEWAMVSQDTARRKLGKLVDKGYIKAIQQDGKPTIYQTNPPQIATPCKLRPLANCEGYPPQIATPHLNNNNIYNKQSAVGAHAHASSHPSIDFNYWWELYGRQDIGSQKEKCLEFWEKMSEKDKEKCIAYTKEYVITHPVGKKIREGGRKYPYYFLCIDQIWKDEISTLSNHGEPHYLTDLEMEQEWKKGKSVFFVKVGERSRKVTKEDLERYKLTPVGELKP